MNWLLVVIVMGSPVKTDLVFKDLPGCLRAEVQMRRQWSEMLEATRASGAGKEYLDFMQKQLTFGTCIPAA